MKPIRRILHFVNGNLDAGPSFERAAAIARKSGAALTLLAVMDKLPREWMRLVPSQGVDRVVEAAALELRGRLERLAADAELHTALVRTKVLLGRPLDRVLEEVENGGYDLVTVDASARPRLLSPWRVDVCKRLMQACPAPVLVLRNTRIFRRVLAAVNPGSLQRNGSVPSRAVLEVAASIASAEGSDLHIVYCWDVAASYLPSAPASLPPRHLTHMLVTERRTARVAMRNLLAGIGLVGVKPVIHLRRGEPAKLIPQIAASLRADLVVMGMPARAGVRGFLFGNLTEDVYRTVDCPMVTVSCSSYSPPGQSRAA